MTKRSLLLGSALGLIVSGCSHLPLYSGKNFYKVVETRSSNQKDGENLRETRELFCPASRLSDSDDPNLWTENEVQDHLAQKVCLKVVCRSDRFASRQCKSVGDEKLRSELERLRKDLKSPNSTG